MQCGELPAAAGARARGSGLGVRARGLGLGVRARGLGLGVSCPLPPSASDRRLAELTWLGCRVRGSG